MSVGIQKKARPFNLEDEWKIVWFQSWPKADGYMMVDPLLTYMKLLSILIHGPLEMDRMEYDNLLYPTPPYMDKKDLPS